MNARILAHSLVPAALLSIATLRGQDAPADSNAPDLGKLEAGATAFVTAYNKADSQAIAALFTPDGELVTADGDLLKGRPDIAGFFQEKFDDDQQAGTAKAAIEAESVRFVAPGIAIEDGILHLTREKDSALASFRYHSVLARQDDGSWLIASSRDQGGDISPPSAKLSRLSFLLGDWYHEQDGIHVWISIQPDPSGNFLLGDMVVTIPEEAPSQATLRIGWDAASESFASWTFDSLGGHNHATWADSGDGGWLLRARGVTADGERVCSTQEVRPGEDGKSILWNMRDRILGGERIPDRQILLVQRPPSPSALAE